MLLSAANGRGKRRLDIRACSDQAGAEKVEGYGRSYRASFQSAILNMFRINIWSSGVLARSKKTRRIRDDGTS